MNKLFNLPLTAALLTVTVSANAATLSLVPDATTITVGSTFNVDLLITLDESNELPNYLGAYDADLSFDSSKITLGDVTFGGKLGDGASGESWQDFSISATGANIYELSLLETDAVNCNFCVAPYLSDLQTQAAFKLATFVFEAQAEGTVNFDLIAYALGDGFGESISTTLSSMPSVQVTSVPLPSAAFLFLSILPIFGFRKSELTWIFSVR